MKTKDLRIGNLVYVKYTDSNFIEKQGITRVIGLSEEGNLGDGWKIELEALEEDFENVEAYPIELTEEILLKCGFEFSHITGDERVFSNKKINLLINAYDNNIIKFNVFIIKHLHQLQNLYFALTQIELEIKL